MKSRGADLFPVASGVQVPFVGKEIIYDFSLKQGTKSMQDFASVQEKGILSSKLASQKLTRTSLVTTPEDSQNSIELTRNALKRIQELSQKQLGSVVDKSKKKVDKKYLRTVSDGLTFSDEVIGNRGKYNKSSYAETVVFKGNKKGKIRANAVTGRHDARCPVVRHYPCHIMGEQNLPTETMHDKKSKPLPNIKSSSTSDSNISTECSNVQVSRHLPHQALSWDEYLLSLLSRETAEMVVKEHTAGQQSSKLNNLLKKKYEKSTNTTDEFASKSKQESIENHQPNKDADKIVETMADSSNRKEIVYLKEIVHGALPINTGHNKPNEIILNSNSKQVFGKVLEKSYPAEVVHWFDWESREKCVSPAKKSGKKVRKIRKGLQKWSDYPEILEDSDIHKMTLSVVSPTRSLVELDPKTVKKQREDANLVRLVDEWRGKWFLEKKWEDSSGEELLRGMNDINDHVRLSAVSACSKALLNKKIREAKSKDRRMITPKESQEESPDFVLSPGIFEKIIELLTDKCKQVQVASAITLFALNRATQKAKEILVDVVIDGGPPEKWAAAQCLAYADCDSDGVIQELISHVNSPDIVKHSKSVQLLAKLSKHSTNVLYMMAEQLNSSSWRDRVVACQVFPALQGPLSKDVSNKISHLMWTDWSKDVKTAAARALGQTGNGKLVHDKLRERLMHGNEIEILDALRKISQLGLMTNRLLPSFVKCLKSDYVSIRLEAVKTVSAIRLGHDEIIDELLKLSNEERSWKVKAHCIKAIGIVAKPTDRVQEVLLWCLRYEREAAIRAEACRAICNLELKSEKITAILQDRMVVEEDPMVKSEVASTLNSFGLKPTGDLTMLEAIQKEVKRLCNRDNITSAIVDQDLKDKFAENHRKYLTVEDDSSNSRNTRGANSKTERPASQMTSIESFRGFDPILEGYKIRSQSQVSVPEFPHMESPVLKYEVESEEDEGQEESDDQVSDYNEMDKQNEDTQTNYSHSTATYLFD